MRRDIEKSKGTSVLMVREVVVLRDRLDRELEDKYLVTVLAVDGGDPPKTGSVVVNITILDANDNNPQFDNSSYEVATSYSRTICSSKLKF